MKRSDKETKRRINRQKDRETKRPRGKEQRGKERNNEAETNIKQRTRHKTPKTNIQTTKGK